jgi:hypothetical protein
MPKYAGTPLRAQRHRELLPQEHVLQHQGTAAAERGTQQATERRERVPPGDVDRRATALPGRGRRG